MHGAYTFVFFLEEPVEEPPEEPPPPQKKRKSKKSKGKMSSEISGLNPSGKSTSEPLKPDMICEDKCFKEPPPEEETEPQPEDEILTEVEEEAEAEADEESIPSTQPSKKLKEKKKRRKKKMTGKKEKKKLIITLHEEMGEYIKPKFLKQDKVTMTESSPGQYDSFYTDENEEDEKEQQEEVKVYRGKVKPLVRKIMKDLAEEGYICASYEKIYNHPDVQQLVMVRLLKTARAEKSGPGDVKIHGMHKRGVVKAP